MFAHVLHMHAGIVDHTRWADFCHYVDDLERWRQAHERPEE